MTLEEFLSQNIDKLGLKGWLAIHPSAKEQVDKQAVLGTSPGLIHEWLVEEYAYPMAKTSVARYCAQLLREHNRTKSRAA